MNNPKAGLSNRNPVIDFAFLVAANVYPGIIGVSKFGTNEVVGTSYEDIWLPSGELVHLPVATTLEVASSSADDTLLGTGARTFTIEGYDADFVEISETIDLDGQTPVLTTELYLGVNRAYISSGGSGEVNAGDIYVADDSTAWTLGVPDTASAIQSQVGAGFGQTQIAFFTVPANHTAYITSLYVTAATGKTITFRLIAHDRVALTRRVQARGTVTDGSPFTPEFDPWIQIPEKTDIKMQARVDATSAAVSAGFGLVLLENSIYGDGSREET